MTITAEKIGRNLHIQVEGVDGPFVIRPLPGRAGLQITDTYLNTAGGLSNAQALTEALIMAVDGAHENSITGRWEPLPVEEQTNFDRIGRELSQEESEAVLMPAFFWQTVLGVQGVKAYIEGGEGLGGTLKATGALSHRLGLLLQPTSPRSV
jgi:hypothetical protein